MEYWKRHLGQFHVAARSGDIGRRVARKADRSEAWRAQLWIQMRWKTAKQREEQDQVGSEGLMRSRHMRHDRAPEDEEFRKDWILARSDVEGDDWILLLVVSK